MDPLAPLREVARALGSLVDDVVFLGGAVAPLLLSDPGATPIRPTDDVDVVVDVQSRPTYDRLQSRLRALGFEPDRDGPICRFLYSGLVVDVMPTDPDIVGFSNRWYPYAMESARWIPLSNDLTIRVVSPVAFVATKMEAFRSPERKHAGDVLASHDLEDVIAVLDGHDGFADEFAAAPEAVQAYLRDAFTELTADPVFTASLEGLLPPGPTRTPRARRLLDLLAALSARP